jgi:hypothetical protein
LQVKISPLKYFLQWWVNQNIKHNSEIFHFTILSKNFYSISLQLR